MSELIKFLSQNWVLGGSFLLIIILFIVLLRRGTKIYNQECSIHYLEKWNESIGAELNANITTLMQNSHQITRLEGELKAERSISGFLKELNKSLKLINEVDKLAIRISKQAKAELEDEYDKLKNSANLDKRRFDEFLKKHRVYRKFYHNLKNLGGYISDDIVDEHFRKIEIIPPMYLSRAFAWSKSPEKRDFWAKLNDKWQEDDKRK